MNISTYEARIKALEDQLNPPTPGGTGLLSLIVTPDITLDGGVSLNETLAAMMPMEPANDLTFIHKILPIGTLSDGDVFNVSVTPSSTWYAVISAGEDVEISETPGAVLTKSVSAFQKGQYVSLNVTSMASETGTEEGAMAGIVLQLESRTV